MRQTTLCFLFKGDSILLAMKKRGHGSGKWNGMGGKLHDDETPEAAAIRETKEEVGITPLTLTKVGLIDFIFPPQRDSNNQSHIYVCQEWLGEPVETEEMKPQWFNIETIPYDEMWESDAYWLPKIIRGQKIIATVESSMDDTVISYKEYQERKL